MKRGDCLSCTKIAECSETSVERTIAGHTCPLFTAVLEPVFNARQSAMAEYGEVTAIDAMLNRPPHQGEEDGT